MTKFLTNVWSLKLSVIIINNDIVACACAPNKGRKTMTPLQLKNKIPWQSELGIAGLSS